jgi:hypothetical protein
LKKLFIIFLVLSFLQTSVFAKWRPLDLTELIQESETIVLATFLKEISSRNDKYGKTQRVLFQVNETLKGTPSETITVFGETSKDCRPQMYFSDINSQKYLLFLCADSSENYKVVNGEFGALIIENKSVQWFEKDSGNFWNRSPANIKKVKEEILKIVKKNH